MPVSIAQRGTASSVMDLWFPAEIATKEYFDMTNSSIDFKAELSEVKNTNMLELKLQSESSQEALRFSIDGLKLVAQVINSSGNVTHQKSITYDPKMMGFLRVREAAGIAYFDTSQYGHIWIPRFEARHNIDLRSVRPILRVTS